LTNVRSRPFGPPRSKLLVEKRISGQCSAFRGTKNKVGQRSGLRHCQSSVLTLHDVMNRLGSKKCATDSEILGVGVTALWGKGSCYRGKKGAGRRGSRGSYKPGAAGASHLDVAPRVTNMRLIRLVSCMEEPKIGKGLEEGWQPAQDENLASGQKTCIEGGSKVSTARRTRNRNL